MSHVHRRVLVLAITLLLSCLTASSDELSENPPRGEADVWYLGHAGWLVRTSDHLLVFDYTGSIDGRLERGELSPTTLSAAPALLFVSHAHSDHYKPRVLDLADRVRDLTVVMGWGEPGIEAVVPSDAKWTDVSGARVLALHHEFDGIPEGFFLVRSGDLTIYHSGDHGTWSDPPNAVFKANNERLAAAAGTIDIAFLSTFGTRDRRGAVNAGDLHTLDTLQPRAAFPGHCGGCESRYAAFARIVTERGLPTRFGIAIKPGDHFRYRNGELQ
jgi:L-ascorbate metabolism protein UlaG (beta-lactamase superfamily)